MVLNISAAAAAAAANEATSPEPSVVAESDGAFPWATVAESCTFGLVWLTAVAGNGLITCTLLRRGLLTHPSNRLVFSVTLSNLIFSFCVFPCILVSSIRQQWIFGSIWCYVNAFFTVLVTVASSATLAAIALDRYFAIVRPMQYSRKMTRNRANGLLIFAWSLGLLCALPPCFGWSAYEYEPPHRACFINWPSSLSYSAFLLVVTFCFPLVSMIVCYYAILQVARTKCKRINFGTMSSEPPMTPLERIQTLAGAPPTPPGAEPSTMLADFARSAISDSQSTIGNNSRSLRRNRFSFNGRKTSFSWLSSTSSINSTAPVKGMRTIFLVLAAFLLTWIPMLVLAVLDMARSAGGLGGGGAGAWQPPGWLFVFAMWSMCAGSVTYPILYGIYNRAIRKELRLCLSCSSASHSKGWRSVHQFYGADGVARGQRRGSKWSTYSEYAALRPRENSASQAAAAAATVAAAAAAAASSSSSASSSSQLVESLSALQHAARPGQMRKSSQDSGAVIPSDDEELAVHRSCSHTSSNTSQKDGASRLEPIASPVAAAAAGTWRAFHRPRMALAVLAVSLQHIAAHSSHHHHHHASENGGRPTPNDDDSERPPPRDATPPSPAPAADARASSLDEGIEPDR